MTGGPWSAREVDPATWRAPVVRVATSATPEPARESAVVLAYVVSVLLTVVALVALLKSGW